MEIITVPKNFTGGEEIKILKNEIDETMILFHMLQNRPGLTKFLLNNCNITNYDDLLLCVISSGYVEIAKYIIDNKKINYEEAFNAASLYKRDNLLQYIFENIKHKKINYNKAKMLYNL